MKWNSKKYSCVQTVIKVLGEKKEKDEVMKGVEETEKSSAVSVIKPISGISGEKYIPFQANMYFIFL